MLEKRALPLLLHVQGSITRPDLAPGHSCGEGGRRAGAHSDAEVRRAMEALGTPGGRETPMSRAWRRLRTAARDSVRRYRLDDPARNAEDLLQEAFLRLLAGDRSWRRGVDFDYQVARVMDSIASDWRRRGGLRPEICEAGLDPPDDEGDEDDVAASVLETPSPGPTVEDRLVVREELLKMVKKVAVGRFGDDPETLEVLEYFRLGLDRGEMQESTQMPEPRLAAAIRRVRRRAKR